MKKVKEITIEPKDADNAKYADNLSCEFCCRVEASNTLMKILIPESLSQMMIKTFLGNLKRFGIIKDIQYNETQENNNG